MVDTTRARRAPGRGLRLGVALAAVAVLSATACERDLSDELGNYSMPRAINDAGVMAGDTDINHPARFEPGTAPKLLDDPDGSDPMVIDINNAGEIVGDVFNVPGSDLSTTFPVAWNDKGQRVDLRKAIPHFGEPDVQAYVTDLNDKGLAVGWMYSTTAAITPAGDREAVFVVDIRSATGIMFPGKIADAINDSGVVVGFGRDGYGRWVPDGDTYRFESTGGFRPYDIDNDGDMVGTIGVGEPAFWRHGDREAGALKRDNLPDGTTVESAYLTDDDVIVFGTMPGDGSMIRQPVRWRSPEAIPERFPRGSWRSVEVENLNNHGVALGPGTRDDGEYHTVRWDLS